MVEKSQLNYDLVSGAPSATVIWSVHSMDRAARQESCLLPHSS